MSFELPPLPYEFDALQPHINPVSTAFGLQALMMWRQYLDGELKFSINSLI